MFGELLTKGTFSRPDDSGNSDEHDFLKLIGRINWSSSEAPDQVPQKVWRTFSSGFGGELIGREVIPVFVWVFEGLQEIKEGLEVSFFTSLQGFLDLVVAGNDSRVDGFPEGEGGFQVFFPRRACQRFAARFGSFRWRKVLRRKFFLAQVTESIGVVGTCFDASNRAGR